MIVALLGAAVIGLCVGLLGAGGSILTVPILVYVIGQPEKVAIAGSLLIVGAISAIGALPHALARRVDWPAALAFGPAAMVGAFAAAFVGQHLPGVVQLLLLGAILLFTALRMSRPLPSELVQSDTLRTRAIGLALRGLLVGTLTGLVGIGGGFLIVPALAVMGKLPMHRAVATSLVLIPLQAGAGFAKHFLVLERMGLSLDWNIISIFVLVGGFGTWVGGLIAGRVNQRFLRRSFAGVLAVMGIYMLIVETLALLHEGAA